MGATKLMRIILFLFLLSCYSCVLPTEEPLCSEYSEPYPSPPQGCEGTCCVWITEEFYSECIQTWCRNEYGCDWYLQRDDCYPI